jgi:hypothetical protein
MFHRRRGRSSSPSERWPVAAFHPVCPVAVAPPPSFSLFLGVRLATPVLRRRLHERGTGSKGAVLTIGCNLIRRLYQTLPERVNCCLLVTRRSTSVAGFNLKWTGWYDQERAKW